MPMEEKSYGKHLELTGVAACRLDSKMSSSRQQTSDVLKEKLSSPRENQNVKCQVKHKAQTPFSQPYLIPHHELHGHAVYERKVQVKSSGDCQKPRVGSGTCKDDELVKYMSKIPGYLQQVDKGKNIQERALNFGVLDWKRLEKWKYNERMPGRFHRKLPSSSSNSISLARTQPRLSTNSPQRKQPSPCRLHVNSSQEQKLSEGAHQSRGKVIKVQDFPDAPGDNTDRERKRLHGKVKSSKGSCSEIDIHNSKWKELDEKPISEIKALSIDQDTQSKLDRERARDGKHTTRVKEEGDLTHHHRPTEPQNIVLLVPKYSPKLSCSESSQFSESSSSYDRQFEAVNGSRFSDCFSPQELHSGVFDSEVPHSCPLPTIDAINADSATKSGSSMYTLYTECNVSIASCPNEMLMSPTTMEAKSPKVNKSNLEPSVSSEPSKKMNLEAAEQPEVKGRHPSPNRRFSFSLGRISRSFSFKDSSAVPQLSSTYATIKSGPISSETSAGTGNCNRDKASTSGRGRSSPLRRLLDPLMKPRGTHFAEAVQSTSGNKNFVSPMNTNELLQVKNHDISTFQALLQLTIKNDLPFFKLVVDNSSDILAAAVKNIRRDDLSLMYAFYSVHEIKKKSGGWMSQGSKTKNCGFGYNTIGQMRISNSYNPDSNAQDSSNVCLVTESVLYGVDPRKEDVKASELLTREVAAIIVKKPVEKVNEGEPGDKDDQCKQKNYIRCSLGRNENFSSTMVILPGGVHGLPNQGAPSSLIERWRSGGSCDCGGWDIGCKLRIFTNQDTISNTLMPSTCSSNRINLFIQGGAPESKPIFSLAPFKNGLYSVEFNASITLLEAFSICVAIITTRQFSDILDLKSPSEAKRLPEVRTGTDNIKTPTTDHEQVPAKYVTSPPPSPFGRI